MQNNSIMHKTYLLVGMFLFIGFFQNCSNSNLSGALANNKNDKDSQVAFQKIAAPSVDTIMFNLLPSEDRYFELKLTNGHIQEYDRDGHPDPESQYCLETADQEELDSILASVSVCVPHQENPKPDVVCAQYIIEPYAELMINQKVFRLGAQYDSCQVPIDLCEDQANILKDFMSRMKLKFMLNQCKF